MTYTVLITRTDERDKPYSRLLRQADLCDGVRHPIIQEKLTMTINFINDKKRAGIKECIRQSCEKAGCELLSYKETL